MNPMDRMVVELALAIEDPAGIEEIRLARALLAFGRALRPDERAQAVQMLDDWRANIGRIPRPTKAEFRDGVERTVSHTLAAARLVRAFRATLPADVGCLVLTFDLGDGPGHMGYASTANRDDCIKLLREFLSNYEGN